MDAGTLTPDDPAFTVPNASDAMLCASEFSPDGFLHRKAAFMFYARRFEKLGGANDRVWFDDSKTYYQHRALSVGNKLVIPARRNFFHAASMAYSAFCNYDAIRVLNSRSGARPLRQCGWLHLLGGHGDSQLPLP